MAKDLHTPRKKKFNTAEPKKKVKADACGKLVMSD